MSENKSLIVLWSWTVLGVVLSLLSGAVEGLRLLAGVAVIIAVVLWVIRIRRSRAARSAAPPVTAAAPPAPASTPSRAAARGAEPTWHRADPAPTPPEQKHKTLPGYLLLGSDGYAATEVEGEFARMDAIHAAIGRRPKQDEEIIVEDMIAALVPEPTNRYDSNAVMVQINGQHVGYLSRDDAARYQPVLAEVLDHGYAPATRARIWASARPDWDDHRKLRYVANVRLALNEPHRLIPLNDPPSSAYSLLPWGNALQVTGEENHQEWLAEYITAEGDGIAIGTLGVIQGGTARAPKELIEVSIDGERIGQLTPASSQHFIPTVRHLESQGMAAAAWLRVKGSAIAAQVTIQATKAHELPADWFSEPHEIPRLRAAAAASAEDGLQDDAEIRAAMREPMWDEP